METVDPKISGFFLATLKSLRDHLICGEAMQLIGYEPVAHIGIILSRKINLSSLCIVSLKTHHGVDFNAL